ncbi:MAG: phosphomannomutase [Proteobacteria bacterium]|nr:phosphomannomutase [Pseudomonadota bacterium]MBU1737952.1 phosphomannomutase [Pseudomonadota bacterium]
MDTLPCFKAYDIRGRVPDELNEELAYRIGCACAEFLAPGRAVIGHDIRLSSQAMSDALARGFMDSGVEVIDLGLCGTEEIYFATTHLKTGCGVIVTASHNPADYNGMKIVRSESRPVSGDTGLKEIEAMAASASFTPRKTRGKRQTLDNRDAFIEHLLTHVSLENLKPLKIVVNGGNGCAGPLLDRLADRLPFTFIPILCEPDGTFPNGVPNPLLPENRSITSRAVQEHAADLGLAWDGDFDRCFLFDEQGAFIEGYYMVGLLAKAILTANPGEKIIHDPRLFWNTEEIVRAHGGIPVLCKTGHAFIKEKMRSENCIYGGEMSAHHYFRDFSYCDSGMIPWLLVCEILSREQRPLSAMVREMIESFPVSGEINSKVQDPDAVIAAIEKLYAGKKGETDHTDGYSFAADDYRFNIRKSNTEPVLRLNVETRGDRKLMEKKTAELLAIINSPVF